MYVRIHVTFAPGTKIRISGRAGGREIEYMNELIITLKKHVDEQEREYRKKSMPLKMQKRHMREPCMMKHRKRNLCLQKIL